VDGLASPALDFKGGLVAPSDLLALVPVGDRTAFALELFARAAILSEVDTADTEVLRLVTVALASDRDEGGLEVAPDGVFNAADSRRVLEAAADVPPPVPLTPILRLIYRFSLVFCK
jgi:hypothetical protein